MHFVCAGRVLYRLGCWWGVVGRVLYRLGLGVWVCCVEWRVMREKVRHAGWASCRSERKFAMHVQNGRILWILCVLGEFCTGWGAGGVLLGEFCTGRAKKGPCRAVFAAIPRPTLRCTCPLQRHAATIATTPRHSASRRNRVTASPGRNIAPLPDPATATPAKARQARHNKARSRDGSADDGLFFGHADDAGALA